MTRIQSVRNTDAEYFISYLLTVEDDTVHPDNILIIIIELIRLHIL